MAKKNESAITENMAEDFDFSAYMPEGLDAKDLKKVGGLLPIYAPEAVAEGNFPPLCGYMVGIETLPEQASGTKMAWIPQMIHFRVTAPTKAVVGKKEDGREVVDILVGEDVLLPINGNLANNTKLLMAADHADQVFFAAVRLLGQKKVNSLSPMWNYDARLHPKSMPRRGSSYDMPRTATRVIAQLPAGSGVTASGEVYNKDGVVQSVVGAAAAS